MGGMEDKTISPSDTSMDPIPGHTFCKFVVSNGEGEFGYQVSDSVNEFKAFYRGRDIVAKRSGPNRFAIPDIVRIERGVDGVKLTFVLTGDNVAVCMVGGVEVAECDFDRICNLLALKGVQL